MFFTADQFVAHAIGDYTEKDCAQFWAKVDAKSPTECWNWVGTRSCDGYGVFDRRRNGKRFARRAHRIAYSFAKGEIPESLMIRHTCDNPRCCNPNHLIPGTAAQNSQDMVSRGRHWTQQRPEMIARGDQHWTARKGTSSLPRGVNHHQAKFTMEEVRAIRTTFAHVPQRVLAKQFGVSQGAIWQIRRGNHWKHALENA